MKAPYERSRVWRGLAVSAKRAQSDADQQSDGVPGGPVNRPRRVWACTTVRPRSRDVGWRPQQVLLLRAADALVQVVAVVTDQQQRSCWPDCCRSPAKDRGPPRRGQCREASSTRSASGNVSALTSTHRQWTCRPACSASRRPRSTATAEKSTAVTVQPFTSQPKRVAALAARQVSRHGRIAALPPARRPSGWVRRPTPAARRRSGGPIRRRPPTDPAPRLPAEKRPRSGFPGRPMSWPEGRRR